MIHMAKEEVRVDVWNKQEQDLYSGDCYVCPVWNQRVKLLIRLRKVF